jgi:hypothetical protein
MSTFEEAVAEARPRNGKATPSNGKTKNEKADTGMPTDPDWQAALAEKVCSYIRLWDSEEDVRRRSDREGANAYYSRHWQIAVPRNRAAITCNIIKPLVDHSIAIMTKQQPTWVVTPSAEGDIQGSRNMRRILMRQFDDDDMLIKSRQALRWAKTTRTCAAKTFWDPTLKGSIGDVTTDIIPPFRCIFDNRTRFPNRMQFIGDRAVMTRTRAMQLYKRSASKFIEAGQLTGGTIFGTGTAASPAGTQFSGGPTGVDSAPFGGTSAGGTIVNGSPVVTAFTGRSATDAGHEFEVEIIEMYHKDPTLVPKRVAVKDEFGQEVKRIARDEETNAPMFTQDGEFDEILGEPGFKLVKETQTELKDMPKYPFWRRTTLLMPDREVVDDRAWDAPQPYSLLSDNEPLEGAVGKGTALDCIDIQASTNVSLSTMLDNLRFSAYRAFKASNQAQIEKANLIISPGDVIRTGNDVSQFVALEFQEMSQQWFGWINLGISLMEKIFGLEGIMQGNAKDAPRTDSAKGFDSLAEIGGSRIVEQTQRFCEWLSDIGEKVGWWAQREYTEAHAIQVENLQGELTYERASSPQLAGTYDYKVRIGSTLAWNDSAVRGRIIEDYQLGLRDKVNVWQQPAMGIDDVDGIKQRIETENPMLGLAPPPRSRQQMPQQGKKAPKPKSGATGQFH